jgi:hypothetical protein
MLGFSGILMAQPAVQAAPPSAVDAVELPPIDPKGLVVVELFSSQACLFCATLTCCCKNLNDQGLRRHATYASEPISGEALTLVTAPK